MPRCYQLVGVPGSGKSTWVASQDWTQDCVIVSTDEFVEAHAQEVGKTYAEVFDSYMPAAVKLMADKVIQAREAGKDIIWDQTSTTFVSRKKKFDMLPDYEHIAVIFETPPMKELGKRLRSRPGKEIPGVVIANMIDNFSRPTLDEGFVQIWGT